MTEVTLVGADCRLQIPSEDFTDEAPVIDDSYGDDVSDGGGDQGAVHGG